MKHISHDSEIPAQGQQVITACAFIHKSDSGKERVVLPRRAMTKKFLPGVYELPGGHVEFGEYPVTGLRREVQEELGIAITVGDPFYVFTYTNEIKGSHSIEIVYFATITNDSPEISLNSEDHSEYGWFAEEEILGEVVQGHKPKGDPEIAAILKGFALLRGEKLHFG